MNSVPGNGNKAWCHHSSLEHIAAKPEQGPQATVDWSHPEAPNKNETPTICSISLVSISDVWRFRWVKWGRGTVAGAWMGDWGWRGVWSGAIRAIASNDGRIFGTAGSLQAREVFNKMLTLKVIG